MYLKSLFGEIEGGGHPGDTATNDQTFLRNRYGNRFKGIAKCYLGGSHAEAA